jgi:2-oxoglutarate dehydrogenase E2 component (dihydrolipoamide succinyltransferase)
MGESIFEGTITKWLKKAGEKVQRDEPLFEISTDKVDAEIPAPASGILQEIKVSEGNTVQVNTVVGVIGDGAGAAASAPAKTAAPAPSSPAPAPPKKEAKEAVAPPRKRRSGRRRSLRRSLLPARPQARPRAQCRSRKS